MGNLRDKYTEEEWISLMDGVVDHPQHYGGKDNVYEAIKVIDAWGLDFALGNAVKYISRAGKKTDNPLEDLEKAKWYICHKIELLKKHGAGADS
jgi:hypothetical protein